MDFKFRSSDGQPPPTYRSQSSSFTYFTEQAMRAGYSNNNFGRPHDFFRNPNDMREAIQREMEKERIREEIIAGEIARRRVLEAEVRRELMMEKEMGFRRSDGFPFVSNRFEPQGPHRLPILHQHEGRTFEERIALSLEERLGQPSRRDTSGFEMVPFQRRAEAQITEIKPVHEVNKDKVILLGKPSTNITGVKRKAATPPAADTSEFALVGSKKLPKEEWSCAICQVSATSERGLNEHLEGKKHKSKEAALRAQKTGKNFGIGILPKKTPEPIKLVETTSRPGSLQIIEKKKSPLLKKKPLLRFKQHTDVSKTEDGKMDESRKSKFKFWCEMCQAGAFSEKVMNIHRNGKKHARLLELKQNGGAAQKTPMAKKQSEDVAEEETGMTKDVVVVMSEEATNLKVSQEIAQEETQGASEKADGVEKEKEAHPESQEVEKEAHMESQEVDKEAHVESQEVADTTTTSI